MRRSNEIAGRRCCVLMSTYNGERFLRDQLDSILNQHFCDIDLVIRDDGSTDRTRDILEEYRTLHSNIFVEYGENIGVVRSFLSLLNSAEGYKCYFLCDQDDVWLPHKAHTVSLVLEKFGGEVPALCYSAVTLIDADGVEFGRSVAKVYSSPLQVLTENVVIGCTCAINDRLLTLFKESYQGAVCMHDWWLAILASLHGVLVPVPEELICYRQHGRNVVGIGGSFFTRLKRAIAIAFGNHTNGFDVEGQLQAVHGLLGKSSCPAEMKRLYERLISSRTEGLRRAIVVLGMGGKIWRRSPLGVARMIRYVLSGDFV